MTMEGRLRFRTGEFEDSSVKTVPKKKKRKALCGSGSTRTVLMVSKSHDKEDLILLRKTKQGVETNGTGGFVGVERWKRTDGSGSHR